MKFKVEPKDFLLFCIYCGLLLYLCAIAVLNISSLTHEGTFYGLLPFEAFTGNYLPLTLILFIASFLKEKREIMVSVYYSKENLAMVILNGLPKKI